ncbi:hypothetical protein F4810DRAFT_79656 [Camillea tinctor]|nr:hypothetical protein F4810DRAFT_79656 [Camillea tinctor]
MFSRHWNWNDHSSGPNPDSSRSRRNDSKHSRHHKESKSESGRHLTIIDLDASRQTYIVGLKPTSNLNSITSYLRKKYSDGPGKIPNDASIRYFSAEGQELQGDELPTSLETIRYRILNAGDDGSFRFRWRGRPNSRWLMSDNQLDSLIPLVQRGCSIGSLRQSIKEVLESSDTSSQNPIDDANQIVIEAVGGIRPGPLPGNNWDAEKTSLWLSRCFQIYVRSRKNYFIFKGFNEEYIWHKPTVNRKGYVSTSSLKQWLKDSVLNAIYPHESHRQDVDISDIRLSHDGHTVKDHSEFKPGKSFSFEVPRQVGDSYIEAESWLVPTTESCVVCGEDKRVSEMPHRRRITKACSHKSDICKECVASWITSSLETVRYDRLKCPECVQLLKFENVRAFATPDTFKRYDELFTRAKLTSIPEFQWCLNPRCDSGQILAKKCTKAKCHDCRYTWCAHHNVPWHRGETCKEYDNRNRDHSKDERLSEKKVRKTSRKCPKCKGNVHKYLGCDHITCICGHQWCWECFEPYTYDGAGYHLVQHKPDCESLRRPVIPPDHENHHRQRHMDRRDRLEHRRERRREERHRAEHHQNQQDNFADRAANFDFANLAFRTR